MTDDFPIEADEDLNFVCAGEPFFGGRFAFSEAIAAGGAIPWDRLVMHEIAITIPERSPLHAGEHSIIRKYRAHVGDRILKNGGGFKVEEIFAIARELKRTENRIRIRRDVACEQGFDDRRDERRRRDGGRVADGGRIGDSRGEGNRR